MRWPGAPARLAIVALRAMAFTRAGDNQDAGPRHSLVVSRRGAASYGSRCAGAPLELPVERERLLRDLGETTEFKVMARPLQAINMLAAPLGRFPVNRHQSVGA